MRFITCRFCGHDNPTGGDACENCGAEFSEGMPESPAAYEGRLLGAPLVDLVSHETLWLDPSTSAAVAVGRMKAAAVDCVLVGDGVRIAGIFTDRDAMLKLPASRGAAPTLAAVMTPDPVVLRSHDTVAVGIHKMAVGGFRHLPLVGEAGAVHVIAARDIFRHLATRLDDPDGSAEPPPSEAGRRMGTGSGRPAVPTD